MLFHSLRQCDGVAPRRSKAKVIVRRWNPRNGGCILAIMGFPGSDESEYRCPESGVGWGI